MPIDSLTNVPKSFLKLGQIRKGAPKTENGVGKDLDHFRVTFLKNVTAGLTNVNLGELLQKRFLDVYGPKPTHLNVMFADHYIPAVWDANYECYKQGGLIAKAGSTADGPYWIFYRDGNTMETLISDGRARTERGAVMLTQPLKLDEPIYRNKNGDPFFLEPVGRLKVVIPELADLAVGYFEFRPESPRDIRNISAELGAYDAVARQYGKTIAGIPFILRRREEEVPARIKGQLVKKMSYVVHLDVDGEWGKRAFGILSQLSVPEIVEGEVEAPQLESGEPVDERQGWNVPVEVVDDDEYVPEPEPEVVVDGKLIDPHGQEAVKIAMAEWNCSQPDAARGLWDIFPKGAPKMTATVLKNKIKK